ncbi:MAG: DUF2062 domain-containing protein [Alphaproteobacteria bacterium]|nr:DUF2062 domain-containing protein [Alphaproteobacteria bacterium]
MFSPRLKPTFWVKLRNFIWPKMGIARAWRYLMHRLARMKVTPHKLALGFAAGAFASFLPFVGFHFILAALTAAAIRGNLIASAIGTVVGNPITFPFIWMASYNVGARMLGLAAREEVDIHIEGHHASFWHDGPMAFLAMVWNSVEPVIYPMLLGGIPLGILCGAVCYVVVRATVQQFKARRRLGVQPAE